MSPGDHGRELHRKRNEVEPIFRKLKRLRSAFPFFIYFYFALNRRCTQIRIVPMRPGSQAPARSQEAERARRRGDASKMLVIIPKTRA